MRAIIFMVFLSGLCLAAKALDLAAPERHLALIINEDGVWPPKVVLFAGERVRFYVTTLERTSHLVIQDKEVSRHILKGEIAEIPVFFERPGKHPLGRAGEQGEIVVLPREGAVRSPAGLWKPRE